MAIHIGYQRGGWVGLVVAGSAFILPAAVIVSAFAWVYVRYGSLPQIQRVLYGVKPVIIAVVLQALWSLGRTAVKTRLLTVIGIGAVVLSFLRVNELLVLLVAGTIVAIVRYLGVRSKFNTTSKRSVFLPISLATLFQAAGTTATTAASVGLWPLFLFFLKVGSVLFGSGYVLLALLRGDLVERWHWLTNEQLLDAIAVGQVTPGPVFTTATFIGYLYAAYGGVFGVLSIWWDWQVDKVRPDRFDISAASWRLRALLLLCTHPDRQ
jgi:chromate transporter